MPICTNCGNTLSAGDKFCNICGTPVSVSVGEETELLTPAPELSPAPAYDPNHIYRAKSEPAHTPVYEPVHTPSYEPVRPTYPSYPSYAKPVEPAIPTRTKVLGFVGMGLGIGGLVLAVIGILYTLIGLIEAGYGLALGFSIGFGLFSMPLSIVGRMLANKSADEGNPSKACSIGSGLGLGGLITSAVMLFLGFIELTML